MRWTYLIRMRGTKHLPQIALWTCFSQIRLRELIRKATDADLDKKVKGRNNLRFSTVHVKKYDKCWENSRGLHLGLIQKADGTYAIPSRNIVSEYPNHVGDDPRSPLWSFSKSVAMINKENIPPNSGLGYMDTTHDELRVSKRRRSGDQSDQTTTNQGRTPLILMSKLFGKIIWCSIS